MYIRKLKVRLGDILLQKTTLSSEQLKDALITQGRFPSKVIGEILVEKGYIEKEDVDTALVVQQGYPYISVANYKIESRVLKKVPSELMWKFTFIPLDIVADQMTIAMASLSHKAAILEGLKGYKTKIFISTHKEIREALTKYYG
jgi:type IV pilus assembly protein PilB